MKKITAYILTAFLLLTIIPAQVNAGTEINSTSVGATQSIESAEANVFISRLNEINSMDKSKMSSMEKKQLRKEVRSIKNNLSGGGGVYLSVGAVIIIILLLILLL